jgi:hypothetical protein
VFLFRARKKDIDENGEVIFKITPAASKQLKPGAFYNFSVLANAFDLRQETEYKKLTTNGSIRLEYGAQDLLVKTDVSGLDFDIINVRLELTDTESPLNPNGLYSEIVGMRLESIE